MKNYRRAAVTAAADTAVTARLAKRMRYGLGSGVAATMVLVAGNGLIADVVVAAAGILAAVIVTVGREWFWLRALRQPGRDLDQLLARTRSAAEAEQLGKLLQTAHNQTLAARAGGSGPKRVIKRG